MVGERSRDSLRSGARYARVQRLTAGLLLLVGCDWFAQRLVPAPASPPPEPAHLVGLQDILRTEAGLVSVLNQDAGARWRTSAASDAGPFVLHLRGAKRRHTVSTQSSVYGDYRFVSTGPLQLLGRFEARLTVDDVEVWAGPVDIQPALAKRPEVVAYDEALAADPAADPQALLEQMSESLAPLSRAALARWAGRKQLRRDVDLARTLYLSATSSVVRNASPTAAARLLRAATYIDISSGRLSVAQTQLDRAREWLAGIDGVEEWMSDDGYRARIEFQRARPHEALRHLRVAAALDARVGDEGQSARTRQKLGLTYLMLGRYREAIDLLQLGLEGASRPVDRAYALGNLADAHLRASEAGVMPQPWAAHRARLEEALQAMRQLGTSADDASLLAKLAHGALRAADVSAAASYLAQITDWSATALGPDAGFCRLVRAEVLMAQGALPAARELLKQLELELPQNRGRGSREEIAALLHLAEIEGEPERPRLERLEQAWASAEAATGRLQTPGSQSRFLHANRRLAVALSRARARAGRIEDAASVLIQSHERLLNQLRTARLLAAEATAFEPLAAAKGQLRDVEDCLRDPAGPRGGCEGAVATARLAVDDEARRLFDRVETRSPRPARAGLTALHQRLGAAEGLLVSQRSGADVVLFLIAGRRTRYATGALPEAWLETMAGLRRLFVLGPVDPSSIRKSGGVLAARIPVVRWAGWRGPKASGERGRPLVVADPRGDLPASLAQGRSLALGFGARLIRGAQANLRDTRSLLRTRPEWLIYLGHGSVSDRAHWSTRLNLFDGPLGVYALLEDRVAARVVLLIGCGTGATPLGQGIGLPEVLVQQGSEAVLASVDVVGDGASDRFVRDFTEAARTSSLAEAFRVAVAAAQTRSDPVWERFRLWQGT